MSHDGDKLIRQLSLVAYLMAERRPVTARDAKGAVEGYREMSDEAFARRFYADRAELLALGIPLRSQRDEFTGEELYTLPREQYFLPPLHLTDQELAALQTALYLLEGQFAYAEPLRLALQNLALGRPNPQHEPARGVTLSLAGGGYTPEIAQRLAKLEGAISKQRTVVFPYFAMSRGEESTRKIDPYALYFQDSHWYVVGKDHDRGDIRVFRVSRIRGDIRFATRKERDFRAPEEFDVASYRDRAPWQLGEVRGEADLHVAPSAAWLVERLVGAHGQVEVLDDRSARFTTPYALVDVLAQWILGMNGQVVPRGPAELVDEVEGALRRAREAHCGAPPAAAAPRRIVADDGGEPAEPPVLDRRASPVAPERFAVLQALLADLLERCGAEQSGEVPAHELEERYGLDHDGLIEQINLLNLVNFGGGCYAVYAEVHDDTVRVDKELYGDDFRRPARLSPLEAKAILMALDLVGLQVAAGAGASLASVRRKVEAAMTGNVARQVPPPTVSTDEEDILSTLNRGLVERRLVAITYLGRAAQGESQRLVEPYLLRGVGSDWYVECWDRSAPGERTFRVDRVRSAELLVERFEPREGLANVDAGRAIGGGQGTASILFSPAIAARETEGRPNASELVDGGALVTVAFSSEEWLETEVIKHRGEAVLLEPQALRERIARRAEQLAVELRALAAAAG